MPPRARDAARCSSWRTATSAATSSAGSHEPFDPSVQTTCMIVVGADQVGDLAPGRGPLGQGAAGAELDVVGVGADGEGPGRHRRQVHAHEANPATANPRSAGRSTSAASDGSRTTRKASPSRWASAAWRANDPGP